MERQKSEYVQLGREHEVKETEKSANLARLQADLEEQNLRRDKAVYQRQHLARFAEGEISGRRNEEEQKLNDAQQRRHLDARDLSESLGALNTLPLSFSIGGSGTDLAGSLSLSQSRPRTCSSSMVSTSRSAPNSRWIPEFLRRAEMSENWDNLSAACWQQSRLPSKEHWRTGSRQARSIPRAGLLLGNNLATSMPVFLTPKLLGTHLEVIGATGTGKFHVGGHPEEPYIARVRRNSRSTRGSL